MLARDRRKDASFSGGLDEKASVIDSVDLDRLLLAKLTRRQNVLIQKISPRLPGWRGSAKCDYPSPWDASHGSQSSAEICQGRAIQQYVCTAQPSVCVCVCVCVEAGWMMKE